jgi:hypothetical protein
MPTCPAYDCSGGDSFRVHEVRNPSDCKIPPDIGVAPGQQMFRCSYCGFIWIEKVMPEHILTLRIPVGFYDSMSKPNVFFATPSYRLKEDIKPKHHRK